MIYLETQLIIAQQKNEDIKKELLYEDLEALFGLFNASAVIALPESSGKQSIYHNRCVYEGDRGMPTPAFIVIYDYIREFSISAKRTLL
jgi:hypothetical protein